VASDNNENENPSVSVPVPLVAAGIVAGLAVATYIMLSRSDDNGEQASPKKKMGKTVRRRVGLMAFITLLENDATRKVVLAALRAIARRS
jgi:hypothetical protein